MGRLGGDSSTLDHPMTPEKSNIPSIPNLELLLSISIPWQLLLLTWELEKDEAELHPPILSSLQLPEAEISFASSPKRQKKEQK